MKVAKHILVVIYLILDDRYGKKTQGKWIAWHNNSKLGFYDTEQEAKLAVVDTLLKEYKGVESGLRTLLKEAVSEAIKESEEDSL